ncbi:MAG: CHASE2 domain-containing protein [Verrucomicrobia bacterium]|nr:CHASE2 domain-containing protein [Verrucomicrobiota bacterium]
MIFFFPEGDWQYQQSDNLFVETAKAYGRQISAVHLNNQPLDRGDWNALARFELGPSFAEWDPSRSYTSVLAPFKGLLDASGSLGHVNLVVDVDGVARRHAAVAKVRGRAFPSLALAAAAMYRDIDLGDIGYDGAGRVQLGDRRIPVDRDGCFRLHPSKWTYTSYPIADVIAAWQSEGKGEVPRLGRAAFKGKIVLIGALATGVYEDSAVTSMSTRTGGVEILASAAESILHGRYIRDWMAISILFIAVYAFATGSHRLSRPHTLALIVASVTLLHLTLSLVALFSMAVMLPVTGPMLALVGGAIVQGAFSWYEERRALERVEALGAAKDDLTHMVVHDLRGLLGPIMMGIDMVEEGGDDALVRDLLIPTVRDASEQMLCQINAMLDTRRLQEGRLELNPQVIKPHGFFSDIIGQFQMASRRVDCPLDLCGMAENVSVYADGQGLDRTVRNLIWNALKFADKGSAIEIGCLADDDGGAHIFVRNHCKPIPADRQTGLFDAFSTGTAERSRKGFHSVGLGLAFCRLACEAHGGNIRLVSPCAGWQDGVQVTIYLPPERMATDGAAGQE